MKRKRRKKKNIRGRLVSNLTRSNKKFILHNAATGEEWGHLYQEMIMEIGRKGNIKDTPKIAIASSMGQVERTFLILGLKKQQKKNSHQLSRLK